MRGAFLSNAFPDTSAGEPEQDANSALTELDKGLRSTKVGEQCEAIVRFPRLFEKYPFPILINSSFLKLADVFRMGNNFLRLWVLRVCQQSEKHLDKILNVDEFLRRVFSVLHSNDSVARALALRTLGAVAGIIPERQNVHHAIRRGLDSHDNVEVDAAIYATTRFAAHSNAFAVAMCNKLSDMVESENTAAERRDKLVRALRTVHGGAVRAEGVLKLLQSLMEQYPSSSFVRSSIAALTDIAVDTVVHVPDQVEVLLNIAVEDPRWSVRRAALLGLARLAQHAALWPPRAIQGLVAAAVGKPPSHVVLCLQVMKSLVKCPAVCAAAGSIQSSDALEPHSLRQFCADSALSPSFKIASTAVMVLTDIVVHCYEEHLPVEGSDLMMALESLVIATGHGGKDNTKALRISLRCLVLLSDAEPTAYAMRTASLLGDQLSALPWRPNISSQKTRLLTILEAICGLSANLSAANHVKAALPALRGKMAAAAETHMETDSDSEDDGTALVLLLTSVMQERAAAALTMKISTEWQVEAVAALNNADGWTRYRVARAALRYGHHDFAVTLLSKLKDFAPSESTQRWLCAMERAARADGELEKDGIPGLERASAAWELASEAANSSGNGGMASSWLSARACALSALARAASAARALCTQPPPAVAHAHSQTNREPTAKVGACAVALRKAASALQSAAQKYADIAKSAFHADDSTLEHLDIAEYTYSNLSALVLAISMGAPLAPPRAAPSPRRLELRRLIPTTPLIPPPNSLTHKHAKAVLSAVSACCTATVWPLGVFIAGGSEPLCRLALSPAAKAEHAQLPLSHRLALHVEGLITTKEIRKSKEKREVKGVQLTITATPHPRTNEKTVELTNIPPILTAVQTVTPVRDFFSAQQLVSVPTAGLYTVAVDAAFVDQRGVLWSAGGSTMSVKAHEDPASKSNTTATRGRF